jgi:hypothetical protein
VQPEVSHDRAKPLAIDVRVASRCCDALVCRRALAEMTGTRALAGERDVCVERPTRVRCQAIEWKP